MSASGPALRRSPDNQVFVGVLAGLADFFGVEARRVRIAYVILSLLSAGFPGLLLYLLLLYVVPDSSV
jgi:phage shock protein C